MHVRELYQEVIIYIYITCICIYIYILCVYVCICSIRQSAFWLGLTHAQRKGDASAGARQGGDEYHMHMHTYICHMYTYVYVYYTYTYVYAILVCWPAC